MTHYTTLLAVILRSIVDTHPLKRTPILPWQLSIVEFDLVCLWDAREEASQAIAEAIASQNGEVVAATSTPLVGVLVSSDNIEELAAKLTASYGAATGGKTDAEHPF
jgi:hypothetical protein